MAWGFGDEPQLTYGWALALCYHVGWFKPENQKIAVAVMTAESQRYPDAWHENTDEEGNILSTDWGLFQLNDKAQDIALPYHLEPIANAQKAYDIFKNRGKQFTAWAAYNSGNYERWMPFVEEQFNKGRWRTKLDKVVKYFG